MYITIISRFATKNTFLGLSNGEYGKYFAVWFNAELKFIRLATAEDVCYAAIHDTAKENGSWEVQIETTDKIDMEVDIYYANLKFGDLSRGQAPVVYAYDDDFSPEAFESNWTSSNATSNFLDKVEDIAEGIARQANNIRQDEFLK